MPLSDAAIVGDPIVAESNFGDGFREDFNTLDIETSSTPGNTTGTWHYEFMHANIAANGFIYGDDERYHEGANFVHAQINDEEQAYNGTRKPLASFNPLSVANSVLTITSRPASGTTELDWARVKGFEKTAAGATTGALLFDMPVKYLSGEISTFNRFAASFARFRVRCKTPYGADGSSADFNQRHAIFPAALWLYMDIPKGCDLNGDPMGDGQTTFRPGRPNGSGNFHEIDVDENFGESATRISQTYHEQPKGSTIGIGISHPKQVETGKNLRSEWRVSGCDVFPEKIAFHLDGIYTHVIPASDELRNGLFKYVPVAGNESETTMVAANEAQTTGRQQHADGSTRYMCHAMICNLARDGKWPRDQARQYFERGDPLPPHQDTVSMEIDYIEARPLITDNPDNFPMRINGVPTAVDGATGGTDPGTEPGTDPVVFVSSLNIPYRSNITIEKQDSARAGDSFTVRALLPYGVARSSKSYVWDVSPEFEIISESSDGFEIAVKVLVNPATGTSVTGVINLTTDDL